MSMSFLLGAVTRTATLVPRVSWTSSATRSKDSGDPRADTMPAPVRSTSYWSPPYWSPPYWSPPYWSPPCSAVITPAASCTDRKQRTVSVTCNGSPARARSAIRAVTRCCPAPKRLASRTVRTDEGAGDDSPSRASSSSSSWARLATPYVQRPAGSTSSRHKAATRQGGHGSKAIRAARRAHSRSSSSLIGRPARRSAEAARPPASTVEARMTRRSARWGIIRAVVMALSSTSVHG